MVVQRPVDQMKFPSVPLAPLYVFVIISRSPMLYSEYFGVELLRSVRIAFYRLRVPFLLLFLYVFWNTVLAAGEVTFDLVLHVGCTDLDFLLLTNGLG